MVEIPPQALAEQQQHSFQPLGWIATVPWALVKWVSLWIWHFSLQKRERHMYRVRSHVNTTLWYVGYQQTWSFERPHACKNNLVYSELSSSPFCFCRRYNSRPDASLFHKASYRSVCQSRWIFWSASAMKWLTEFAIQYVIRRRL